MEGETTASINTQMTFFHERVLPSLEKNIKCGNSLIDLDYYDGEIDFGDEKKIRPFNWQRAFPEVFAINKSKVSANENLKLHNKRVLQEAKDAEERANELIETLQNKVEEPEAGYGEQTGFDIVIGNPPYVMLQNLETREVFDYALRKFNSAKYKIDTYQLFIEQSVKLLRKGGLLGFITPNTFLKNIHSQPLRKFILDNAIIKEIVLFNYSVFTAASVDTCVFIIEAGIASKASELTVKQSDVVFFLREMARLKQSAFTENKRNDFNLSVSETDTKVLSKIINASKPLSLFCGAYFGIQTFDRKKFVSIEKVNENYEPVIDGGNIDYYSLKPAKEYVNYIPTSIKSGGNEIIYRQDRICIRQIGASPIATYVPANIFTLNTVYNVYLKEKGIADLKFLLGIINSRVTSFFWKKNNADEKKTFPKIKKEAILSIPIPEIKGNNQERSADEIIKSVHTFLSLNQLKQATTSFEKLEQLNQRIAYTDEKINKLVYELYGLSEEEIGIVEGR